MAGADALARRGGMAEVPDRKLDVYRGRHEREDRPEVLGPQIVEARRFPVGDELGGADDAAALDRAITDQQLRLRVAADQVGLRRRFEGELHRATIAPVYEFVRVGRPWRCA